MLKHFLALILGAVLLFCCVSGALALAYTDEENLIQIEIPEDEDTLYYTPDASNLFEDLLEQVENSGRDLRLLIRRYTPEGVLAYTIEAVAYPLETLAAAAADPMPAPEDPAVDPRSLIRPGAAAAITDITQASDDVRGPASQLVRSTFAARFNYSEPHESSLRGVPALLVEGTGLADTSWADYDCEVYLVTNDLRLLVISLVYRRSEDQQVKKEADALLTTLRLGDTEPEPTPSPSKEMETPAASASPEDNVPASAAPTTETTPGLLAGIRKIFDDNPNLLYYLLAASALLILLIALIVHHRAVKKRKAWAAEDEETAWGEVNTAGYEEQEKTKVLTRRRRTEEENMGASDQPINSRRQTPDYTEDISRYTQQPGPEVNDVSRFTHGYDEDDDLSDELRALQDESFAYKPPTKIQSVGSRVERNRRKKKKK